MLDWVLNTPQLIYNSSDYHAPLSHEKQKGWIELIKNELILVKNVVAFFHIYNRIFFSLFWFSFTWYSQIAGQQVSGEANS